MRHSLGALLLLVPLTAAALSTDRDQPIELEADQAELDNSTGVSVYSGNVRFVAEFARIQALTA